jgi:hypothetical protein
MAKTYFAYNGPRVTTAAPVSVTTGTAIKTLMQLSTPSSEDLKIIEWGISFDGTSGTPIKCELVETGAIAATVTAYTSNDIVLWNQPNDAGSLLTLGTANSGYTASAEGTITATRMLDLQLVSPAGSYLKQFPLGREPVVPVSKFLRIRVTAPVAVNAYCYLCWEE